MAERVGSESGDSPDFSELEDVSNVLLLAPSLGARGSDACTRLLTQTPAETTNVLVVTYTDSPAEVVERYREGAGGDPSRGAVAAIGETDPAVDSAAWTVRGVENPADLTGIGIELSEFLSGMANATDGDDHIVACFDSLTSLLQYADLQRAFRFLHVVTGRVKTVGGVGHYHLDPEAHDQQTLATLKGLFDAVVEVDEDGTWDIQR